MGPGATAVCLVHAKAASNGCVGVGEGGLSQAPLHKSYCLDRLLHSALAYYLVQLMPLHAYVMYFLATM